MSPFPAPRRRRSQRHLRAVHRLVSVALVGTPLALGGAHPQVNALTTLVILAALGIRARANALPHPPPWAP